jgi:hypothetical protein
MKMGIIDAGGIGQVFAKQAAKATLNLLKLG